METAFETTNFPVEPMINIFLFPLLKVVVIILVVYSILLMVLKQSPNDAMPRHVMFFYQFFYFALKSVLSTFIAFLVFFYDFNLNQFIFEIPEKMNLSTLFVGILAVYEAIASFMGFVKELFEYLKPQP